MLWILRTGAPWIDLPARYGLVGTVSSLFGQQIGRQRQPAVRACGRAVIGDRVGMLGDAAAVALVGGLGATGAAPLASLPAVTGGGLDDVRDVLAGR